MSPTRASTATDSYPQKPQKLTDLRTRLSVVTGVFRKAFPHNSRTIEARSCLPVERPSARLVLNRHLGCGRDPRSAQFTSFPFLLLRDLLPGKFHHFQSFPYRAQVLHAHLRRDSWRARAAVVDASSRLTGRKPVFGDGCVFAKRSHRRNSRCDRNMQPVQRRMYSTTPCRPA